MNVMLSTKLIKHIELKRNLNLIKVASKFTRFLKGLIKYYSVVLDRGVCFQSYSMFNR